jgi:radical SAM superfamily enzyme YgiQ (UPF0313 family)
MLDSILVNTPISSPLHPQLNLPLLKSFLSSHGFRVRIIDSNIKFIHSFIGHIDRSEMENYLDNPIQLLGFYNGLEKQLREKSKEYEGLYVGLRSLACRYDRIYFDSVLASLADKKGNPFIEFYEKLISEEIEHEQPKIVGIAVTFQDQIIPAFTLADLLRKRLPEVKIVMGGQIITRCYDTMMEEPKLKNYYDYLALWDGENGLLDIHNEVIRKEKVDHANVIKISDGSGKVDREANAPKASNIPPADYTDFNLSDYLMPELLIPLQTTRGCYAKCAFCAIPFGSNGYKVKSVQDVIDDITGVQKHVFEKYGKRATFFKFMEDTSSPSLLYELSVEVEKQGLDVKWETFARLEEAFSKPGFMGQLYRGGCRKIHWGLETNDPSILKSMHKNTNVSYLNDILELSAKAGVHNFCFVLIGFPNETDEMRQKVTDYIVNNLNIHTLTLATFDLTRKSPMEQEFSPQNEYSLAMVPAKDFQVRLPYTVNNTNWKEYIVPIAHKMMIDIIRNRPDIGFVTLFPDQIRSILCDKYGNDWGRTFVDKYGKESIKEMLLSAEKYAKDFQEKTAIDVDQLPEPLLREHFRTKEDMALVANAVQLRKAYENRRFEQV